MLIRHELMVINSRRLFSRMENRKYPKIKENNSNATCVYFEEECEKPSDSILGQRSLRFIARAGNIHDSEIARFRVYKYFPYANRSTEKKQQSLKWIEFPGTRLAEGFRWRSWRRKFPFTWAPREGVEMLVSCPTRNKHRRRASRQSETRPLIQPFLAASRPSADLSKNVIKQTDISPSRSRVERGWYAIEWRNYF